MIAPHPGHTYFLEDDELEGFIFGSLLLNSSCSAWSSLS
jgi:hypothetical protein